MKNAFDGLISRLHTNEERISVPKVILIETSKNNKKKNRKMTEKQNRMFKNCQVSARVVICMQREYKK